ncbi:ribonuclease H2, subunit C [Infundibulicybe gibba]|nr:ribonuclease H2, subunit C [Infundibulicybe gibba]
MSNPTILLAPVNLESLTESTPYLMPFRIDYSGKAPISTYLRVEAAGETVGGPSAAGQHSQNVKVEESKEEGEGSSRESEEPKKKSEDTAMVEEKLVKPIQSPTSQSLSKRVTDATTRFISSFRGRTIQGLKVNVPEGRKDQGEGEEQNHAPLSACRGAEVLEEDEPVQIDEGLIDDEPAAVRTLMPTSQFSSFVVWHPDHPVDENQDVYIRSLTEWTRLAAEIHRVPE